jgi:hypothetical protein
VIESSLRLLNFHEFKVQNTCSQIRQFDWEVLKGFFKNSWGDSAIVPDINLLPFPFVSFPFFYLPILLPSDVTDTEPPAALVNKQQQDINGINLIFFKKVSFSLKLVFCVLLRVRPGGS